MKFTYLGKEFKSLRKFKDNESNLIYAHFAGYLELPGYKHEDFYKIAKANNAFADFYLCDDKKVVPCGGSIVIWKD